MFTLKITTEAGVRFSRGVHPAQTVRGLGRAAQLMHELGNGVIAQSMIDAYPKPAPPVHVRLPMEQIERLLGVPITIEEAVSILTRLQFKVRISADVLDVEAPDHRTDINPGETGIADLCEEIGRIHGYDRLPNTLIGDDTPVQHNNDELGREEQARDVLVKFGLREAINYRLTTPEAEARLDAPHLPSFLPDAAYLTLANPISLERAALRHSLLNGLLEVVAANQHHAPIQRIFEIGPIFLPHPGQLLPDEPRRLAMAITGARMASAWQDGKTLPLPVDFYDLKGIVESLLDRLHIRTDTSDSATFHAGQSGVFHPGRSAEVRIGDKRIGCLGEIHPVVRTRYDIAAPVFAAELDLEAMLAHVSGDYQVAPLPTQPAVYQDIALIVDIRTPAAEVARVISAAGGELLRAARLFDVYTGDPIPPGKKNLAYALTYQANDRTLTDTEVAKVHRQIMKAVERELGAKVRT
jgi:phenylalanyl-tRNA synthetase beta chain